MPHEKMTNYKNGEAPEDNKVVITDITVYFPEKGTQNQRHEVCFNIIRFGVVECWSIGAM